MYTKAMSVTYYTKVCGSTHYIPRRCYRAKFNRPSAIISVITRIVMVILATIFVISHVVSNTDSVPGSVAQAIENTVINRKTMEVIQPQVTAKQLSATVIIANTNEDPEPQLPPEDFYQAEEPEPVLPLEVTITEVEPEPELPPIDPIDLMNAGLGNGTIDVGIGTLTKFDLPDKYYPGIDYSSFQPWMSYKVIKDRTSAAYKVISDSRMYIDENGMCRFEVDPDNQFTIDGIDDYVIALGTYYKPQGTCGDRWLVITSTGAYTAITGDEKSDAHTDEHHMFSSHEGYAGVIEWLVDTSRLESTMKCMGSVTYSPVEALRGDILYIYRID